MAAHILVLDDERAILELIEEILVAEGYRVSVDERVNTTPEEIERMAPDLLIIDYMFGTEAAGLQTLQQLKLKESTASLPIILCTAATQIKQDTTSQLGDANVEILYKPFEVDDLIKAVERKLKQ